MCDVFEGAVPLIAKQLLSTETRDEYIGKTIGIIIADRGTKRVADSRIACRFTADFAKSQRDFFDWALLRRRTLWRGMLLEESIRNHHDFFLRGQRPTSRDEQIPSSISIVIDGADATPIGFNHRDEPCAFAVVVREVDADIGTMRSEL